MTVFWTMFWLGCIGFPLIILIAVSLESGGHEKDTSHIWVYKRSGAKSHDATVREVWEHNHPGRKWADHQASQSIGCGIVLGIALIVFLAWLADQIFVVPTDRVGLRLFWIIGGPILGGLSAGGIYALQSKLSDYKSDFWMVLHIIALVVMGLGVIGALVLTFLKIPLPISNHWLWAPLGAMCLFMILDSIKKREKKVKAGKGGEKFEDWVVKVLGMITNWDIDKSQGVFEASMAMAITELSQGNFDWKIRNDEFFKMTEGILVDLIQGKAMSIPTKEIYQARDSIIKAVQAFYFYMVDHFREYEMHPVIKKAIKKQR